MKKIEKNKGITIISLAITIIVLVILAGVSISLMTGENGVITRSREIQSNIEQAEKEGQEKIDSLKYEEANITDGTVNLNDATPPTINSIKITDVTNNSFKVNVDVTETGSGLAKIEYSIDDGEHYITPNNNLAKSYTFTDLKVGIQEYKVKVKVTDVNNNSYFAVQTIDGKDEEVTVLLKSSLNHVKDFSGIKVTLVNKTNVAETQEYTMQEGENSHKFRVDENEQYTIKVADIQNEFYECTTPEETQIYTAQAENKITVEMEYKETGVYLYKNGKENTELVGTFNYKKTDYSAAYTGTGSYSKNSTNMSVSIHNYGSVMMLTENKINLEGYSKMSMNANITQNTNAMLATIGMLQSTDYQYIETAPDFVNQSPRCDNKYTGAVDVELNIGEISQAYIGVGVRSAWTEDATMQINEVKLLV